VGPPDSGDGSQRDRLLQLTRQRRVLQRKRDGVAQAGVPSIPQGSGTPISAEVRARMEPKLGADLSQVKLHSGQDSARAAAQMGARAFTVGENIHFNAGQLAPGTREGDRLLAHELTHVVQGRSTAIQRKAEADDGEHEDEQSEDDEDSEHEVSDPADASEQEADSVADKVMGQLHDGHEEETPAVSKQSAPAAPIARKPENKAAPAKPKPAPKQKSPQQEIEERKALLGAAVPAADQWLDTDPEFRLKIWQVASDVNMKMIQRGAKVRGVAEIFDDFKKVLASKAGVGGMRVWRDHLGEAAAGMYKAEQEHKRKARGGTPEQREAELATLRDAHKNAFISKIAKVKDRFVIAADQWGKFQMDMPKGLKPDGVRHLRPGVEAAKQVKETEGLITGGANDGDMMVSQSLQNFVRELRAVSADIQFGADTYHGHDGKTGAGDSPYTLDVTPRVKLDDRGFYEPARMLEFFRHVNKAAGNAGVEWKALYNDFTVASQINQELGVNRIKFQWTHGPAGHVLHVHFDIMPKVGSPPEVADRQAEEKIKNPKQSDDDDPPMPGGELDRFPDFDPGCH
jgi:hypothetical protein